MRIKIKVFLCRCSHFFLFIIVGGGARLPHLPQLSHRDSYANGSFCRFYLFVFFCWRGDERVARSFRVEIHEGGKKYSVGEIWNFSLSLFFICWHSRAVAVKVEKEREKGKASHIFLCAFHNEKQSWKMAGSHDAAAEIIWVLRFSLFSFASVALCAFSQHEKLHSRWQAAAEEWVEKWRERIWGEIERNLKFESRGANDTPPTTMTT